MSVNTLQSHVDHNRTTTFYDNHRQREATNRRLESVSTNHNNHNRRHNHTSITGQSQSHPITQSQSHANHVIADTKVLALALTLGATSF